MSASYVPIGRTFLYATLAFLSRNNSTKHGQVSEDETLLLLQDLNKKRCLARLSLGSDRRRAAGQHVLKLSAHFLQDRTDNKASMSKGAYFLQPLHTHLQRFSEQLGCWEVHAGGSRAWLQRCLSGWAGFWPGHAHVLNVRKPAALKLNCQGRNARVRPEVSDLSSSHYH